MSEPMPFQILSLSGGGFLGLYTVSLLAELEEKIQIFSERPAPKNAFEEGRDFFGNGLQFL